MAECDGLENRYGVKPIVGSNPTPSARPSDRCTGRPSDRRTDRVSVSSAGSTLAIPDLSGLMRPLA